MKIGIDINVKNVTAAFLCRRIEELRELTSTLQKLSNYLNIEKHQMVKKETEANTSEWIAIIVKYEIKDFKYPHEYIRPFIETWIYYNKKRIKRLTAISHDIVNIGYATRNAGHGKIKETLVKLFRKYNLKLKVDREIAEELKWEIQERLREWKGNYKKRIRIAINRLTHTITLLSRRTDVIVKLEALKGIDKRYGINEKVKIMRWRYVTRLVRNGTPKEVKVGLVDPRGTSSLCPVCRNRLLKITWERKYCKTCRRKWDRDVVAAINIALKPTIQWLHKS